MSNIVLWIMIIFSIIGGIDKLFNNNMAWDINLKKVLKLWVD